MNGITNNLHILDATREAAKNAPAYQNVNIASAQAGFKDVLSNTIERQVQFSKHANMRLNARNITLTGDQMSRVENGIMKADEKGIRDSLVLVDNLALVVNVKSRTVITAMNRDHENVFNHIDGAVIV